MVAGAAVAAPVVLAAYGAKKAYDAFEKRNEGEEETEEKHQEPVSSPRDDERRYSKPLAETPTSERSEEVHYEQQQYQEEHEKEKSFGESPVEERAQMAEYPAEFEKMKDEEEASIKSLKSATPAESSVREEEQEQESAEPVESSEEEVEEEDEHGNIRRVIRKKRITEKYTRTEFHIPEREGHEGAEEEVREALLIEKDESPNDEQFERKLSEDRSSKRSFDEHKKPSTSEDEDDDKFDRDAPKELAEEHRERRESETFEEPIHYHSDEAMIKKAEILGSPREEEEKAASPLPEASPELEEMRDESRIAEVRRLSPEGEEEEEVEEEDEFGNKRRVRRRVTEKYTKTEYHIPRREDEEEIDERVEEEKETPARPVELLYKEEAEEEAEEMIGTPSAELSPELKEVEESVKSAEIRVSPPASIHRESPSDEEERIEKRIAESSLEERHEFVETVENVESPVEQVKEKPLAETPTSERSEEVHYEQQQYQEEHGKEKSFGESPVEERAEYPAEFEKMKDEEEASIKSLKSATPAESPVKEEEQEQDEQQQYQEEHEKEKSFGEKLKGFGKKAGMVAGAAVAAPVVLAAYGAKKAYDAFEKRNEGEEETEEKYQESVSSPRGEERRYSNDESKVEQYHYEAEVEAEPLKRSVEDETVSHERKTPEEAARLSVEEMRYEGFHAEPHTETESEVEHFERMPIHEQVVHHEESAADRYESEIKERHEETVFERRQSYEEAERTPEEQRTFGEDRLEKESEYEERYSEKYSEPEESHEELSQREEPSPERMTPEREPKADEYQKFVEEEERHPIHETIVHHDFPYVERVESSKEEIGEHEFVQPEEKMTRDEEEVAHREAQPVTPEERREPHYEDDAIAEQRPPYEEVSPEVRRSFEEEPAEAVHSGLRSRADSHAESQVEPREEKFYEQEEAAQTTQQVSTTMSEEAETGHKSEEEVYEVGHLERESPEFEEKEDQYVALKEVEASDMIEKDSYYEHPTGDEELQKEAEEASRRESEVSAVASESREEASRRESEVSAVASESREEASRRESEVSAVASESREEVMRIEEQLESPIKEIREQEFEEKIEHETEEKAWPTKEEHTFEEKIEEHGTSEEKTSPTKEENSFEEKEQEDESLVSPVVEIQISTHFEEHPEEEAEYAVDSRRESVEKAFDVDHKEVHEEVGEEVTGFEEHDKESTSGEPAVEHKAHGWADEEIHEEKASPEEESFESKVQSVEEEHEPRTPGEPEVAHKAYPVDEESWSKQEAIEPREAPLSPEDQREAVGVERRPSDERRDSTKDETSLGDKFTDFAKKAGAVIAAPAVLAAYGAKHAYDSLKEEPVQRKLSTSQPPSPLEQQYLEEIEQRKENLAEDQSPVSEGPDSHPQSFDELETVERETTTHYETHYEEPLHAEAEEEKPEHLEGTETERESPIQYDNYGNELKETKDEQAEDQSPVSEGPDSHPGSFEKETMVRESPTHLETHEEPLSPADEEERYHIVEERTREVGEIQSQNLVGDEIQEIVAEEAENKEIWSEEKETPSKESEAHEEAIQKAESEQSFSLEKIVEGPQKHGIFDTDRKSREHEEPTFLEHESEPLYAEEHESHFDRSPSEGGDHQDVEGEERKGFGDRMAGFAKKAGMVAGGIIAAPVALAAYGAKEAYEAVKKHREGHDEEMAEEREISGQVEELHHEKPEQESEFVLQTPEAFSESHRTVEEIGQGFSEEEQQKGILSEEHYTHGREHEHEFVQESQHEVEKREAEETLSPIETERVTPTAFRDQLEYKEFNQQQDEHERLPEKETSPDHSQRFVESPFEEHMAQEVVEIVTSEEFNDNEKLSQERNDDFESEKMVDESPIETRRWPEEAESEEKQEIEKTPSSQQSSQQSFAQDRESVADEEIHYVVSPIVIREELVTEPQLDSDGYPFEEVLQSAEEMGGHPSDDHREQEAAEVETRVDFEERIETPAETEEVEAQPESPKQIPKAVVAPFEHEGQLEYDEAKSVTSEKSQVVESLEEILPEDETQQDQRVSHDSELFDQQYEQELSKEVESQASRDFEEKMAESLSEKGEHETHEELSAYSAVQRDQPLEYETGELSRESSRRPSASIDNEQKAEEVQFGRSESSEKLEQAHEEATFPTTEQESPALASPTHSDEQSIVSHKEKVEQAYEEPEVLVHEIETHTEPETRYSQEQLETGLNELEDQEPGSPTQQSEKSFVSHEERVEYLHQEPRDFMTQASPDEARSKHFDESYKEHEEELGEKVLLKKVPHNLLKNHLQVTVSQEKYEDLEEAQFEVHREEPQRVFSKDLKASHEETSLPERVPTPDSLSEERVIYQEESNESEGETSSFVDSGHPTLREDKPGFSEKLFGFAKKAGMVAGAAVVAPVALAAYGVKEAVGTIRRKNSKGDYQGLPTEEPEYLVASESYEPVEYGINYDEEEKIEEVEKMDEILEETGEEIERRTPLEETGEEIERRTSLEETGEEIERRTSLEETREEVERRVPLDEASEASLEAAKVPFESLEEAGVSVKTKSHLIASEDYQPTSEDVSIREASTKSLAGSEESFDQIPREETIQTHVIPSQQYSEEEVENKVDSPIDTHIISSSPYLQEEADRPPEFIDQLPSDVSTLPETTHVIKSETYEGEDREDGGASPPSSPIEFEHAESEKELSAMDLKQRISSMQEPEDSKAHIIDSEEYEIPEEERTMSPIQRDLMASEFEMIQEDEQVEEEREETAEGFEVVEQEEIDDGNARRQSQGFTSTDVDDQKGIASEPFEDQLQDVEYEKVARISAELVDEVVEEAVREAVTPKTEKRLLRLESWSEIAVEPEVDYQSDLQEKLDFLAAQSRVELPPVDEEDHTFQENDEETAAGLSEDSLNTLATEMVRNVLETVEEEVQHEEASRPESGQYGESSRSESGPLGVSSRPESEPFGEPSRPDSEQLYETSRPESGQLGDTSRPESGQLGDSSRPGSEQLGDFLTIHPVSSIRTVEIISESQRSTPDVPLKLDEDQEDAPPSATASGMLFIPDADPGRPTSPIPPPRTDSGLFIGIKQPEDTITVEQCMTPDIFEMPETSDSSVNPLLRKAMQESMYLKGFELPVKQRPLHEIESPDALMSPKTEDSSPRDEEIQEILGSAESLDRASVKSLGSGKRYSTSRRSSNGVSQQSQEVSPEISPEEKASYVSIELKKEMNQELEPEQYQVVESVEETTDEGFETYSHGDVVPMEPELETVEEEPEDNDSLNGSGSSSAGQPASLALLAKYKHTSSDNVSESSLQEFERIERLVSRDGGSLTGSEIELGQAGASSARPRSIEGSLNSLAEFERIEAEIAKEAVDPEEVMMLSDIREESEAEDMSVRDTDEEEHEAHTEIKVVPIKEEDDKALTPTAISPADSIEQIQMVETLEPVPDVRLMEASTDSLEPSGRQQVHEPARRDSIEETSLEEYEVIERMEVSTHDSLENLPHDRDSLLEGASQEIVTSQEAPILSQDTVGTYQEHEDLDKDSLAGEMDNVVSSYVTTLTTFETKQMKDDGTVETISRRVETRVVNPVEDHVTFTGTENAESVSRLPERGRVDTVDEQGNVTTTTVTRSPSHQ
ncbi:unnamed protein product, partial [Mesorhabditis belari]|uniref:Uncharacterized protein n=1 Tax=Mesorhabditis belari TaxID=2138241 RepID=A0AAF3J9Y3_9BILA